MTSPPAPSSLPTGPPSPTEVVNDYLAAFYSGDYGRARILVADEFSFRGPFVEVAGKDAFFASAAGLQPILRGHRLLRQWADGANVSSLYEVSITGHANSAIVPMSEWHTVEGNQLTRALVLFDPTFLRTLLTPP